MMQSKKLSRLLQMFIMEFWKELKKLYNTLLA